MAIKLTDSRREEIKRLLLKPLKKDIEDTVKERPKENQCTNTEGLRAELSALFKKD
jgi:hypothetical protein